MKKLVIFWSIFFVSASLFGAPELNFEQFKEKRVESLKKNWLPLVGLEWLKEGENLMGSSEKSPVKAPHYLPPEIAKIYLKNKVIEIEFLTRNEVTIDGKPVELNKRYPVQADLPESEKKATQIKVSDLEFYFIDRKKGLAARMRSEKGPYLKSFKGLDWYKEQPEWRVKAKWVKVEGGHPLKIPDILGGMSEEKAPGYAEFSHAGKTHKLYPTVDGDKLFFVFKDQTSGKETYGAARFLSVVAPQTDELVLDFNRAVNPPCAYVPYATCPLPPKENVLKTRITAGEKAPPGGHPKL